MDHTDLNSFLEKIGEELDHLEVYNVDNSNFNEHVDNLGKRELELKQSNQTKNCENEYITTRFPMKNLQKSGDLYHLDFPSQNDKLITDLESPRVIIAASPYSPKFDSKSKHSEDKSPFNKKMLQIHKEIVRKTQLEMDWIENNIASQNNSQSKKGNNLFLPKIEVPLQGLHNHHDPKIEKPVLKHSSSSNLIEVFLIGEIEGAEGFHTDSALFCQVELELPANWSIIGPKKVFEVQQTMSSFPEENGFHVWNHPIQIKFQTSDMTFLPKFIFTVWCLDQYGTISNVSLGKIEIPSSFGSYRLASRTWKSALEFNCFLTGYFLNKMPIIDKSLMKENPNEPSRGRIEPSGVIVSNLELIHS